MTFAKNVLQRTFGD